MLRKKPQWVQTITEAGNVACSFHEAKDQCIFLDVDITAPSRKDPIRQQTFKLKVAQEKLLSKKMNWYL